MMLNHKQQSKILPLPMTNNRMLAVFDLVDQLHTAASEGEIASFTGMSEQEATRWLRDIIYTAQETLNEIESGQAEDEQLLRIVDTQHKVIVLERAE